MTSVVQKLNPFFVSDRAPSPTKRKEDDKSKQRSKEKSGATKEGGDKSRGREKNRSRRSASSGSSRSEACSLLHSSSFYSFLFDEKEMLDKGSSVLCFMFRL